MKYSIYIRSFLTTALIVLLSFTLLGGLSTAWSYRRALAERRSAMTSTLSTTARYVTMQQVYQGIALNDLNLSMWLAMISGVSGFELLVTDVEGLVVACSDRDFRYIGESVPESELALAIADRGTVNLKTLGHIYPERRHIAGMPLTVNIDGDIYVFGYIFISIDLASFRQTWRDFASTFTLIAVNVMVLAFVISYFSTKKQAEPLNEIAGAARRFARGDFAARVEDIGRYDEIGQLAQAFNAMADSLEKLEELRRGFIANLSHELKTPMTVVAGYAEGIMDGTIPGENAGRYLGVMSSETRRLSRLVESMLDISKLQSADISMILNNSFDISEVIRLTLLSFERKIENKQLDVEVELPEEAIMTRGDEDAIMQVVYNLIDNAIKFSNHGGLIRLALWKQGDRAFVSAENSGETIPPEEMPHIFERFHKTDKSRSADPEGVGLGLYIVKTILDNHNEDVFVTSAEGITRFVFTLSIA